MDIIGMGAQYRVVDTHDGRVRKVPLTRGETQEVVKSWYKPHTPPAAMLAIDYPTLALESCRNIQTLLGSYPGLAVSFGNPIFEAGGIYTQDKVPTLGEALKQSSLTKGKQLINGFTNLVMHHWRYGLSERVFNCTINNGVDKHGQIILLDFGELTFDKEEVRAAVISKRWLHSFSLNKGIPEQLQGYYEKKLNKVFTLAVLDAIWGELKD